MFRPPQLYASIAVLFVLAGAAAGQTPPLTPDIPSSFAGPVEADDYIRRVEMIPMRDGIRLHTVILIPKGAADAPVLLTRTPYDADKRTRRSRAPRMVAVLPQSDELFAADGYIRVFQDVRGKYGSEGAFVMTRPTRGPLNRSGIDESTDAYDTIEWLRRNLPESNGRFGMIGSSYEGFTAAMALLDPHPSLFAVAPHSPMIDGWKGDDWFHNGAFRQLFLDYFLRQTSARGHGEDNIVREGYDDYENFRRAGSAGEFARRAGFDQLPWWRKISEHPSYDAFWQGQGLDRLLSARKPRVPVMWVQGLWDQEDIWGGVHAYLALEPDDEHNDRNFLVLGPWFHSQANGDGYAIGPLRWNGDTSLQFRRDVLKPFFDAQLKSNPAPASTPGALVYNTALDRWDRFDRWPPATRTARLYLQSGSGLSFEQPSPRDPAYDEYVADPAKPVPFVPRPIPALRFTSTETWKSWLVSDQRAIGDRTDILTYVTPPLREAVAIAGAPIATLFASTSGTDADWVVKLIDVYPDQVPSQPAMGGYQLGIAMDIFRGRYREDAATPKPIQAGKVLRYEFALPHANHVFLPGHRIMVQIQSSWFPLYDRNPQTYVPNIFFAPPSAYVAATQRIYRTSKAASFVSLPVIDAR